MKGSLIILAVAVVIGLSGLIAHGAEQPWVVYEYVRPGVGKHIVL